MASSSTMPRALAVGDGSAPEKQQQRACANCARSKLKCVWPTPACCQRCSRGGLQCTVPEPGPRKKRGKSTRVKTLEQKVEHILSILTTDQELPATAAAGVLDEAARMLGQPAPAPSAIGSEIPLPPLPPDSASPDAYVQVIPGFRVSLAEADQILREYGAGMLSAFPFCPMPDIGARRMLQEKPIVLKAIITACRPQPSPLRNEIDDWFRSYFAQHIVVLEEKTLDNLQAILIYIAWNDWHFTLMARDTILLQMAMGIAGDLGLSRAVEDQVVPARSIADEAPVQVIGFNLRREPTNAGRRAFLAIFYLTSTMWTLFRRSEPLQHTEYMEQCCRDLCNANEYPTDHLAAGLVRVQKLLRRTAGLFPSRVVDPQPTLDMSHVLALAAIQKELDEVVESMPGAMRQNYILWSHYYTLMMRMYEPTIYTRPAAGGRASDARGEALRACCQSAKSLMELHLSVPADASLTSSIAYVSSFGFANLTLTRLLFLADDPDWDPAAARAAVDYPSLMDRFCHHFDAADRRWEGKRPGNVRYAERMRWAKSWYLAKTSEEGGPELPSSAVDDALGGGGAGGGGNVPHYLEDDAWQMMFDAGGLGTVFQ